MTTLNELAAGALSPAAAAAEMGDLDLDPSEAVMVDETAPAVDELPSLDFMRGYLAAYPHPDVIDATMRQWLDALIWEAKETRTLLDTVPAHRNSGEFYLSPTELKVYRYLRNTTMPQPDIARAMFVSINTLKTHAKNIYAKCAVGRRAALRNLPNL